MDPVPRKVFVECPRCRSGEVHVPWQYDRLAGRRREFRVLVFLGVATAALVTLVIITERLFWIAMLLLCVLVGMGFAINTHQSAKNYQCINCNLTWSV